MSHSWSNAGVHVNCESLNCESNNNCQCTIQWRNVAPVSPGAP